MKKEKYVLGLDIGISSVGWGLIRLKEDGNLTRIIDTGVKIFSPGEVPKTGASKNLVRRSKRGVRRITRRREFRVDRVRYLLNLNGYLGNELVTGKVSEINDELTNIYNSMLKNYYVGKNISPYELKVKALDEKLNRDELSIVLVHYAKHRGYKSNRVDENESNDTGKVKAGIAKNEEVMKAKGYRTVSEMFVKDKERFGDRIRNTNGEYQMCVTREMYLDEINKVLDAQIKFGLITDDFKNDYINIWSSQRHYAKGPGGNSKYGGNLIERMTGKCKFDGEPRAPKFAPSSEIFVALTKLVNLRYKSVGAGEYKALEPDQIKKVLDLAKKYENVTYAKVLKELKIDDCVIKGLMATNKEKSKAIETFKKKENLEKFNFDELSENQKGLYNQLKVGEVNKRVFLNLKGYTAIRKSFTTKLGTDKWTELDNNMPLLDLIAKIVTDYKVDEDVEQAIRDNGIDESYIDAILALPNFKDHNRLSSKLIRELNKIMVEGISYDEAMEKLGYNHSDLYGDFEKADLLIPINQDEELNNQRVIRSLSQARGIINSIIKKYGMPERINIETARELAKSRAERNEISKKRDENQENNERVKNELVDLGLFKSVEQVKPFDLLKYKLWKEQIERCAYSLEPIPIEDLFNDNLVQVDHILPYSRTFDDTYFNKTLVKSKYNQEKGNKTPYEWLGNTEKWENFKAFISNLDISERKKENYLLNNLTLEMEGEYRNQNLNDTKFISKYLVSYIKANLNVPYVGSPSGSITGKLRNYWNLNGLTHSLESESYYVVDKEKDKKNRENHLHHAMDALIIAATNSAAIRKVSVYERYKRYLDNKPLQKIREYANEIGEDFDQSLFVDEVTGEIYCDSLKSYIDEISSKHFFKDKKNNTIKTYLPEPYEGFTNEAKIRVYEQSKELMDFKLKEFNYTDAELANVKPIIPKFAKNKIGGSLHGETYYSLRKRQSGEEELVVQVSRVDISSKSFDAKKLENILEKDGGSKEVYLAIKEWLGDQNGEKAFKDYGGYPRNPKTGNLIKKVKIESSYDGKGHIIDDKVVAKESICRIDVYTKEGEEKLYFVAYDAFDLFQLKEKKNNKGEIVKKSENIDVDVWWGQSANHQIMKVNDLNQNYNLYISLVKNDFVEIELNNGKKGFSYIVGCSSGLLEVSSPLGDGFDLIINGGLFSSVRSQYQLTISSIKSIKKFQLNNLGKIEKWDIDKSL